MGRTFVEVLLENYDDLVLRRAGKDPDREVRTLTVQALADTGSALLCLHKDMIEELGLRYDRKVRVSTGNGVVQRKIHGVARITIIGRSYRGEIMEVPHTMPILLGYIPLENLDLVVDPTANQVVPNPAHGGKYTLDLL
jgi:predicted aspartyl protease